MAPSMIPKIVMPTCTVLMNRTGSSISAERRLRGAAATLGARLETAAARRHERVLGGHEDRVPEHEQENCDDAVETRSRPVAPGAQVLGGARRPRCSRAV